ncbi:MAG: DUF3108 domain-containing protein [Chloroflexota bacterium]
MNHLKNIFSCLCLILIIGLLAGCGQPDVQPMIPNDAPWENGEISLYRVLDRSGEFAGNATISVHTGSHIENSPARDVGWTIIRDVAAPDGTELLMVEVTQKGIRPIYSRLIRGSQRGQEQVAATYNNGQVDLELTTYRDVTTYERVQIPSNSRDYRTLLLLVRSLPLAEGYATRINSFLPIAGTQERVQLVVRGQEEVTVPAGTFNTWQTEITLSDAKIRAWIGTETPYPLYKFTDGRTDASFEMSEFTASADAN